MKGKRCVVLAGLIAVALAASPLQTLAYAVSPNDNVLNGGVGRNGYQKRYYYIDSSCSSTMKTDIDQAWYDWTYTTDSPGVTTPISIKPTTVQKDSSFDFYYTSVYPEWEGVYGVTLFWRYQEMVAPFGYMPDTNWGWTQIMLNSPNFTTLSRSTGGLNRQKGVIAHECGHAMGLWHVNNSNVLMYPYGNTVRVDKCTADELNGINHLYS